MEVSSVSGSFSPAAQVQRPEPDQQTKPAARERDESREVEARKTPVVNLEGQTTGLVVNTTA